MAEVTSGSFNTATYTTEGKTRYLTFSWSRTSYSVDNNTSTISYTLKGAGTYTGWINTRNIKLIVNGTTVYTAAGPIKVYNGTVLKSGTITISHNTNGTKSFSASAECGIYYSAVNSKGSGSWDITTIPRASSVKATNGDIGSKSTISITRASSNFTHTLTWSCLGLGIGGDIVTKTKDTTVSFTIPTSIYSYIPNAKTAEVTIVCITYNGTTELGRTNCKFTATANENTCKPTLTIGSVTDTQSATVALTKDNKKIVANASTVTVSNVTATGNNSATIKSVSYKMGQWSGAYTSGFENRTLTFMMPTAGTLTLTATDSRGYSTTVTYTATTYDYFSPKITANAQRTSQTANTVKVDYSGKFYNGAISTGIIVDWCYVKSDGMNSTWQEVARVNANGTTTVTKGTFTNNNGDFSGSVTLDTEFDYRKEHTLKFRVADCLRNITHECTLFRGVPVYDWGEDDFNFNVPLCYEGKPMDFVIEQGVSDMWTYRKWFSGVSECWGITDDISQTTGTNWGNVTSSNTGTPAYQYPTNLFIERPSVAVSVGYHNGNFWLATMNDGNKTSTPQYQIVRGSGTGTYTFKLDFHVTGRWK